MFKILCSVLLASLMACGSLTSKDGQDGVNGKDGTTGKPGVDGAAGKGTVLSYSTCAVSWPGTGDNGAFDILFSVINFEDGASLLSFQSKYKSAGDISFSESSSDLLEAAPLSIETQGWKAELKSKSEALITRKALSESKTVSCHSK